MGDIWRDQGLSDTCVILSTLIPTGVQTGTINRITINQAYRNLVRDRFQEGKCIYVADMEPPGQGSGFLGLNQPVWANENPVIHPNVGRVLSSRTRFQLRIADHHHRMRATGAWLTFSTQPFTEPWQRAR